MNEKLIKQVLNAPDLLTARRIGLKKIEEFEIKKNELNGKYQNALICRIIDKTLQLQQKHSNLVFPDIDKKRTSSSTLFINFYLSKLSFKIPSIKEIKLMINNRKEIKCSH